MIIGVIAIPLIAAVVIPFARKSADIIFLLTTIVLFIFACIHLPENSVRVEQVSGLGAWDHSTGFVLDGLSALMLLLISLVGLVVGIHSLKWTEEFTFYSLLSIAFAGMNGLVIVADLFSMYVFLEITSLSSFALIALMRRPEGLEAAYKYLMLSAVATAFILLGTFVVYGEAGGVSFARISSIAGDSSHMPVMILSFSLLVIGLAIKAGIVPFHAWVPDAYSSAPNPISVALAGIITKVAGVYTLIRLVFNVYGVTAQVSPVLMVLGIASATVGALMAVTQNDSKRMLAYSSVSQVGYIILGISTGTLLGMVGAIFHLFNHAVLKSLLFLNTSSIEKATGSRDLSEMGGLASRMPVTGATFAIGSLSVAGVPPLNGFWSKLFILIALFQSGNIVIAFIALLVSVVTLGYFLIFHKKALFGRLEEKFAGVHETSFALCLPAVLLAVIAVFSGLFFTPFVRFFIQPAADILMTGVLSW